MKITQLIEIAIQAALKAGDEILDVYNSSNFGVQFKSDQSPLTLADKRAHNAIVKGLESTDLPLLSEEGAEIPYEVRKEWSMFWLVDPLDGTKEFIKRNDEFTVNIALINNGDPIGGVVFVPVSRELYFADKHGACKALVDGDGNWDSKIQKLPIPTSHSNFVVAGSRSHRSKETDNFIKQLGIVEKELEIITLGSSLKMCRVAEGTFDLYPKLGPTMEWDTAAAHAIVKCAGKEIYRYPTTDHLVYNKQNLLNPWFIVK